MIEPEMAFTDLQGDMDLAEDFVKYLIRDVRDELRRRTWAYSRSSSIRICSRGSISCLSGRSNASVTPKRWSLLKKSGEKFEFPVAYGANLQSEHERWLTEKHFKCPVTVFNYPEGDQAVLHAVER